MWYLTYLHMYIQIYNLLVQCWRHPTLRAHARNWRLAIYCTESSVQKLINVKRITMQHARHAKTDNDIHDPVSRCKFEVYDAHTRKHIQRSLQHARAKDPIQCNATLSSLKWSDLRLKRIVSPSALSHHTQPIWRLSSKLFWNVFRRETKQYIYRYIYIYIFFFVEHTHIHTHTYIYIYIYIYVV
jgi:hypothetical protein